VDARRELAHLQRLRRVVGDEHGRAGPHLDLGGRAIGARRTGREVGASGGDAVERVERRDPAVGELAAQLDALRTQRREVDRDAWTWWEVATAADRIPRRA